MLPKFKKKNKKNEKSLIPTLILRKFVTNSEKFQENFEEVLGKFGCVFDKFWVDFKKIPLE